MPVSQTYDQESCLGLALCFILSLLLSVIHMTRCHLILSIIVNCKQVAASGDET